MICSHDMTCNITYQIMLVWSCFGWYYVDRPKHVRNWSSDPHDIMTVWNSWMLVGCHKGLTDKDQHLCILSILPTVHRLLQGMMACTVWILGQMNDPVLLWRSHHWWGSKSVTNLLHQRRLAKWLHITTHHNQSQSISLTSLEMISSQTQPGITHPWERFSFSHVWRLPEQYKGAWFAFKG